MSYRFVPVLSAAVLIALTGCNQSQKAAAMEADEDTAQCKAFKGETDTVNKWCVVVNDDPVNPKTEPVLWKGQKVGFCCNGCKPRWAKMSEAEKDAALARVVAMAPPKAD